MKNFIIPVLLLCSAFAFGQGKTTDIKDEQIGKQKVEVRSGGILKVAGYEISGISNDPTLADELNSHLVTEYAVAQYVAANAGSNNATFTLVGTTLTITDGGGSLGVSFTGWDTDASNDLTTSTSFGGDVTGIWSNLQLGAGSVTGTELATGSVLLSSSDVTGTLPPTLGGTGLSAFSEGSLLDASGANTWSALGAGTNGFVLTMVGGAPAWGPNAAGAWSASGDNITNTNAGAVVATSYFSGTLVKKNDAIAVNNPDGGNISFWSPATGAIEVMLPASLATSTIEINFSYSPGLGAKTEKYSINAYINPSGWQNANNVFVTAVTNNPVSRTFRFGNSGGRAFFYVNDSTEIANYSTLIIESVLIGKLASNEENFAKGWNLTLKSSGLLPTIATKKAVFVVASQDFAPSPVSAEAFIADYDAVNIIMPGGADTCVWGSITGAPYVTIPSNLASSSFEITIFNGLQKRRSTYVIGNYATWTGVTKSVVLLDGEKYNVRFGTISGKQAIFFGETSSVWAYLSITIRRVTIQGTAPSNLDYNLFDDEYTANVTTAFPIDISIAYVPERVTAKNIEGSVNNIVVIGSNGLSTGYSNLTFDNATSTLFTPKSAISDGSAANPAYTFASALGMGMSKVSTKLVFSNGGIERLGLGASGEVYFAGAAGTAGQILQSAGPGAPPTWVANTGLPSGTNGQTLRHNGTSWVASSAILNTTANVDILATTQWSMFVGGQGLYGVATAITAQTADFIIVNPLGAGLPAAGLQLYEDNDNASPQRIRISTPSISADYAQTLTAANGHIGAWLATASTTLDFPDTGANSFSELTISLPNAVVGKPCIVGYSTTVQGIFTAYCASSGSVTIRFTNNAIVSINPTSTPFEVHQKL